VTWFVFTQIECKRKVIALKVTLHWVTPINISEAVRYHVPYCGKTSQQPVLPFVGQLRKYRGRVFRRDDPNVPTHSARLALSRGIDCLAAPHLAPIEAADAFNVKSLRSKYISIAPTWG
jgi:hypothetical protein